MFARHKEEMKINLHADRAKLEARLKGLGTSFDGPLAMTLYRFINPKFSKPDDIVAGAGTRYADGRWNLVGAAPMSYTALAPETAMAEALAQVRYYRLPESKALPLTLVALNVNVRKALDLRDGKLRQALRLAEGTIRHFDWRAHNQKGEEALTQAWGHTFGAAGYEAIVVPSAADPKGTNVLVFPGNLTGGSIFAVDKEVEWPAK